MCRAATKIVAKHKDFISNPELLSEGIRAANWIDDVRARKEVFNSPSIVLTTAGMLNGGPVLSYLPVSREVQIGLVVAMAVCLLVALWRSLRVPGTMGEEAAR